MALWVHHASRGVRRRCPRGGLYCCFPSGKGRLARAPLHSPRLCDYLAEGRAVALLLKGAGRFVPPSRSQHFVLPLASGGPISAACVCLSSCCWCATVCCAFDWWRDPLRFGVRFRGVCSGALLVSLRDVEGLVRLAPRWRFGGALLGGSEMAASLVGLMLVGLLLCLVLLRCFGLADLLRWLAG